MLIQYDIHKAHYARPCDSFNGSSVTQDANQILMTQGFPQGAIPPSDVLTKPTFFSLAHSPASVLTLLLLLPTDQ